MLNNALLQPLPEAPFSRLPPVLQIPIGAEAVGIGADDLEDLDSDNEEYFRLGEADEQFKDYSSLKLKPDHQNRCAAPQPMLHQLL